MAAPRSPCSPVDGYDHDADACAAPSACPILTGVASKAADARAAHAALQALATNRLIWNVKHGDEIADALAESLHEPNVHVRYVGARRLEVSGTARRPGTVSQVIERFRGDIGPLVAGIDVDVTRTDDLGVAGDVDSALSADSVKYVESSDGTKTSSPKCRATLPFIKDDEHVEAMTDKLIDVVAELPQAVAQRHRHGEVRELADALDTVASQSTDTASTEAQAARVVVDGFRAAALLCRSATV